MKIETIAEEFTTAIQNGDGATLAALSLAALFARDGTYHDSIYGPFTGHARLDKQ